MDDQKADTSDYDAALDKAANQGGRPGAQAKGGTAARPGDPTSPKQAAEHSTPLDRKLAGDFGDHKGEDMGRDGTE